MSSENKKRKLEINNDADALSILTRISIQNERIWAFMCNEILPGQAEICEYLSDIGQFFSMFGLRKEWKNENGFPEHTGKANSFAECTIY